MKKITYLITAVVVVNLITIVGNRVSALGTGSDVNIHMGDMTEYNDVFVDLNPGNDPVAPTTINQFDSVFFDLFNAVVVGNLAEFPVIIRSDDVINSLDFAFKYDHSQLEYDTIISLATYVDYLSYYNTNDSTVRLTSYSFTQPYTLDTALFIVRFNVLAGYVCIDDFNSTTALLNGDLSSHKFEQCQFTGISEEEFNAIKLFPNPAGDLIVVEAPVDTDLQIVNLQGQQVGESIKILAGKSEEINTEEIANGIYFFSFTNEGRVFSRKIIVNH